MKKSKKKVVKEDPNIKLLKVGTQVLVQNSTHCELSEVVDVNENSALLSNGISLIPRYNKKDKVLTSLNLKSNFLILVSGSRSKRIWKLYQLGNKVNYLQKLLETFKLQIGEKGKGIEEELLDSYYNEINCLTASLEKFTRTINE